MGAELFSRHARAVRLNVRCREYAGEIRRILAEITTATEGHREHAEARPDLQEQCVSLT